MFLALQGPLGLAGPDACNFLAPMLHRMSEQRQNAASQLVLHLSHPSINNDRGAVELRTVQLLDGLLRILAIMDAGSKKGS